MIVGSCIRFNILFLKTCSLYVPVDAFSHLLLLLPYWFEVVRLGGGLLGLAVATVEFIFKK